MVMDSELCSYRHTTRQLEKRYNINKTMTVLSWCGITNLLYQFFKCRTIRQDEHSLYRASLISSPPVYFNDGLSRRHQCVVNIYYRWMASSVRGKHLLQVNTIPLTMLLQTVMKPWEAWSFYNQRISTISDFRLSRVSDTKQIRDKTWTKQTLK